jgi:hypothetical protein
MTSTSKDYREMAREDAWETVEHFVDEMVVQWRESGEVSDDMNNDYPDGDAYHHETHVDKDHSLLEASNLLDQLSEYEETDGGLWDGLEPRRAIAVQAAYTYGNAVYDLWRENVEELNDVLADLADTLPDDADDDTRADVGERVIRMFVSLGDDIDCAAGEEGELVRAAWKSIRAGDATAAGALADWYAEHGEESKGKKIRAAVGIEK